MPLESSHLTKAGFSGSFSGLGHGHHLPSLRARGKQAWVFALLFGVFVLRERLDLGRLLLVFVTSCGTARLNVSR